MLVFLAGVFVYIFKPFSKPLAKRQVCSTCNQSLTFVTGTVYIAIFYCHAITWENDMFCWCCCLRRPIEVQLPNHIKQTKFRAILAEFAETPFSVILQLTTTKERIHATSKKVPLFPSFKSLGVDAWSYSNCDWLCYSFSC